MNDLYRRWFEPPSVQAAVSSMLRRFQSVPAAQLENVQAKRRQDQTKYAIFAAGGGLVFLAVVIGGLVMFAPKPKEREADYGRLALACFVVVAGAGAATYFMCGNNNQKRAERDEAFEQLCRRHPGLRSARRSEIVDSSVGTIPWYHSEEWSHTYGLVSGDYQGSQIISVECTHIVDPILVTTDSRLMQGLAGVASKKHQRLYLRAMDATVFVEPLENVSDLVFVPQKDPSRAYYKRALQQQDCDLTGVFKLPRSLRNKYWMAAAAPEECGGLFQSQLPTLLQSRKWCIVQVVGGHCVVMTSQWHGNRPGRAPNREEAIAENLEFAHAVYQQLKHLSTGVFGSLPTTTEDTAMPASAAPAIAAPKRMKPRRRRPHSVVAKLCLLGAGLPLLLLGLLSTIGFSVDLQRGRASNGWPQADARIVNSDVDVEIRHRQGKNVMRYKPSVTYEYEVDGQRYTGNRLKYGVTSRTTDKHQVEGILAKYPKDAKVKVHYSAEHRDTSVLEPGVQQESKTISYMYVIGTLTLIGLLLSGYGLIGKRIQTMPS